MTLKFYTSVEKVLKQIVRKFWWLFFTLVEVTGENLLGEGLFEILRVVALLFTSYSNNSEFLHIVRGQ